MKPWLLLALTLIPIVTSTAQQPWQLVWSDEFNDPANTLPDPTKWTYDLGNNNGWGNRELESYTKDPANAHMDGQGNLVIRAEPVKTDHRPPLALRPIHPRVSRRKDFSPPAPAAASRPASRCRVEQECGPRSGC